MNSTDTAGSGFAGFQILADCQTAIGHLSLRRRRSLSLEEDIYEMLLDHRLVMSSAVTDSERALTDASLTRLPERPLKLLIGGLGLGFTTLAALSDPRVTNVTVVELLEPVIRWHLDSLLPWSVQLTGNARVRLLQDDFFELLPRLVEAPEQFDAILIDIDDSPNSTWSPAHQTFYSKPGLRAAESLIADGGAFALWCASRPDRALLKTARDVFPDAQLTEVHFFNPSVHREETNYLLLASKAAAEQ